MAEGKQRAEWARTSAAMALYANANQARGAKPIAADAFSPFARKRRRRQSKAGPVDWSALGLPARPGPKFTAVAEPEDA